MRSFFLGNARPSGSPGRVVGISVAADDVGSECLPDCRHARQHESGLRYNPRAIRLFAERCHRPWTIEQQIRHALPYGVWLCADGRQVLFDRDYIAIWERPGFGHHGVAADPFEWVHWIGQGWFFDDGSSPLSRFTPAAVRLQTLKLIDEVLRAWGLRRAADSRSVVRVS
jgi:hypothetical protein